MEHIDGDIDRVKLGHPTELSLSSFQQVIRENCRNRCGQQRYSRRDGRRAFLLELHNRRSERLGNLLENAFIERHRIWRISGAKVSTKGAIFPLVMDEQIPTGHVCLVINAFVDKLAMADLGAERGKALAALRLAS